jgi:hypothetical protein
MGLLRQNEDMKERLSRKIGEKIVKNGSRKGEMYKTIHGLSDT